ncbi:Hypothetical predicted protein [Cloeon dipterum]|uniref:Uncharacterized protein n=1 Tax=Cloeon dipterum TaxID=197152 RepID=A0A8S1DPH3_9INSE|nr:Hypothetical predicted protein [Cloeon dipterum]
MPFFGYDDYWHDFTSGKRKIFETGEKYEKDLEHMIWTKVDFQYQRKPEATNVVSKTKDGEIYLARLKYNGQLLPGYMRNGIAYFAYEGQVIKRCKGHELLYDGLVQWYVPNRLDEKRAVVIGHDEDKNPLFFGSFIVNGIELYGEVIFWLLRLPSAQQKKFLITPK